MSRSYVRSASSSPEKTQKAKVLDNIRHYNTNRKIASIPDRIIKIYHDPQSEIIDVSKMMEQIPKTGPTVGPGQYNMQDTFAMNKQKVGKMLGKATTNIF